MGREVLRVHRARLSGKETLTHVHPVSRYTHRLPCQSLRSCSLLRDPDAIAALCDDLRHAFATVQRALDGTPADFVMDGSEARRTWYTNHCDVVHSLYRNMHYFHMLARHVEDKPPRIHRLEGILKKLATYQAKFMDLARRISVRLPSLALSSSSLPLSSPYSRHLCCHRLPLPP